MELNMYPKFDLYCYYEQFNHLYAPKYFDWVRDGKGSLNFYVDDFIISNNALKTNNPKIAMLIEPRTIQPIIYEWIEQNYTDFDLILTHDDKILTFEKAKPIVFMNWYKTYDVPKTKNISMVCSDKEMCTEHRSRKLLVDTLAEKVDHYGLYRGGYKCDYYECRAEYKFEVVVDNNWSGYWLSEKLANPLASKTVPIYLGGNKHVGEYFNTEGIILAPNLASIPDIVDSILENPEEEYNKRLDAINDNYERVQQYQVFEDYLYRTYKKEFENLL